MRCSVGMLASKEHVSLVLQIEEIAIGAQLADRYELCERLGTGSSGTVFLARDCALPDTMVALKVLHAHLGREEEAIRRFQQEMRLLQSLSHPNIVSVFDLGRTTSGCPFIVLEFLQGDTLETRLKNGPPLEQEETFHILKRVLDALEAMHAAGVIHRDIKPANIHYGPDGTVKLFDLGVGKALGLEGGLTHSSEAIGTPRYMAPEQLHSGAAAPRSDVYAIGLLAYELATGVPFYRDESLVAIAAAQQQSGARLAALLNGRTESDEDRALFRFPREFLEFLSSCLAYEPELRQESAAACHSSLVKCRAASTQREAVPFALDSLPRKRLGGYFLAAMLCVGLFAAMRYCPWVQRLLMTAVIRLESAPGIGMAPLAQLLGFPELRADTASAARVINEKEKFPGGVETQRALLAALFAAGVDPNGAVADGDALLRLAVKEPTLLDAFFEREVDLCRLYDDGHSILSWAAVNRAETFPRLLENVTVQCPNLRQLLAPRTMNGCSILQFLEARNRSFEHAIRMVVRTAPEQLDVRCDTGSTPLAAALFYGSGATLELFLELGADPNRSSVSDLAPICIAVSRGNMRGVDALLRYGAEANTQCQEEQSPLWIAASFNADAVVRLLLDAGAKVDEENSAGSVALHAASFNGNIGSMRVLLEAGADVNRFDNSGKASLGYAVSGGREEAVSMLLHAGAEINVQEPTAVPPLTLAAGLGSIPIINQLLAAGADPNISPKQAQPALHLAVALGQVHVVERLHEVGADLNLKSWIGHSPVMTATLHEKRRALIKLLELGADPNIADNAGNTALCYAELYHPQIAPLLLSAGAVRQCRTAKKPRVPR